MRIQLITSLVLVLLVFSCGPKVREGNPKVLVFTKTMGFKHASIPKGVEAVKKLGSENGFEVEVTKDASMFNEENLSQYAAILFLSTTGNVLDHKQEAAFERYIQSGGGFVGVHAATDTEYDWNWYGKLVGAFFSSHPAQQEAVFNIENKEFEATSFFQNTEWKRKDELYSFKKINPDVNVLITVDESSYTGGTNGDFHPMSWYHEYDGGRSFYTALGHTDESYEEKEFLQHLLGGINYAMGSNLELNYEMAKSQVPPDIDRFTKVPLVTGEFFEPTEMTILPNNDILVSQRRGEILHYNSATKEIKQVAYLDVYYKTLNTPGVNAEEGVIGLQKDPNYATNHWVYVFYSPTGDEWVNRLSRFKFENNVFDLESEQVILDVESQREICCHTGGSIAFGPGNLLYVSTGDNSTPFNEKDVKFVNSGYAPLNDVPGHEQYDARRSSGNTNDLRGKILRIKVNEDGSYDIPEGNLFPVGMEKTRPEIYTMGHRNPYRISVDPKNGYLYWGDVGPDARVDSLETRGPRGYDEMGQAKEAGNFGWPLFIADNKAYKEFDYETGETGIQFDPEKPLNNSRNNTGLVELPKAMPAYVFYPYVDSQEFPQVSTGGRNAMAGPAYYSDLYNGPNALPAYYDGKVIIYDWMRGWMKAVSLFPNGDFNKMEPFASDIDVNNLIDMEVASDGRIYLLEYGSGWFTKNEDSGLGYIEYNGGNRPPLVSGISVDKTSGSLPLSITLKAEARDRENDDLTYIWDLGKNVYRETKEPTFTYSYEEAGEYIVSVEVKDNKEASTESETIAIVAGNTRPEVNVTLVGGNSSFFVPGKAVNYKVEVSDADDKENINRDNIFVSVDYMSGMDKASLSSLGHQQVSGAIIGKSLTQSMDCKTCHKEAEKSIGPNYLAVSEKYKDDPEAASYLRGKMVSGGSGVWGEVTMPAHPNITDEETRQITSYILSLSGNGKEEKSLPSEGRITPRPTGDDNVMVLTASYTDLGVGNVKPLTHSGTLVLPSNNFTFSKETKTDKFMPFTFSGMNLLIVPAEEAWFALDNIDLAGVKRIELTAGWQEAPKSGLSFEVRLNAPDGELVGTGAMPTPRVGTPGGLVNIKITGTDAKAEALYFVYKPTGPSGDPVAISSVKFIL